MSENKCRAKNPALCWKHGTPLTSASIHPISLSLDKKEILNHWNVKTVGNNETALTERYFIERLKRVDNFSVEGLQTASDPRYVHTNGDWRAERRKVHNQIIAEVLFKAKQTPCNKEIILMGGVSGAGKSNIRAQLIEPTKFFTVDPDDVRQLLVEKGMAPSSAEHNYLSPAERGTNLYVEASQLTARISLALRKQGTNIVLDQTMSNLEDTNKRLDAIKASGYEKIKAIFVDIEVETSKLRAISRWRAGEQKRLKGYNPWGGRYMPLSIIEKCAHPILSSKNLETFQTIAKNNGFHSWQLWDNNKTGQQANKISSHDWE